MKKIRVSLKDRSYDILIGRDILKRCGPILKKLDIGRDAVIVTNKVLCRLYKHKLRRTLAASGITTRFELVPDSEKAKSLSVLASLLSKISAYDKNRSVFLIAFGGGVIGDLTGFVASVYKRGTPYVQIPTTLLAQVDSAIGGKTAVDLPIAKNLIGAFYQPKIVLSDMSLLDSLSARQIKNGLAEIIKYGVIKDPKLFRYLEDHSDRILRVDKKAIEYAVSRSSAIKAATVNKDELDKKGTRAILNFGHTIGHAIEAAASYSNKYNHGEAISIGMVAAANIAMKIGLLKRDDANRITALIRDCGLPVKVKRVAFKKIYESHLRDKKFISGRNRFVLPTRIGKVKIVNAVPESAIRDSIKERMAP